MKILWIALLFLCTAFASAQAPRPFVYGGLDLGNDAAGIGGAGVMINAKHFVLSTEASYDTDGKSDQGLPGHNRRLKGSAYYRLSNNWYFGAGARWGELSTKGYAKQTYHLQPGIGKDFFRDTYSFRLQADYVLPPSLAGAEHVSPQGCTVPKGQCTSNVQGPEVTFYLPSPATSKHLFMRFTYGGFFGHTTVTSVDPKLTAQQKASKVMAGEAQMTIMYRF